MIQELYQKAGELHGHYCPGLAIGVRAAFEALRILEVENIHSHSLYCIAESRACFQDGIQVVFGTTLGNGNLELRDRGKTAFNFYDRANDKNVRLLLKQWPEGMSKVEVIEYLLTAPLEQIFDQTEVHFDAPPDAFKRYKTRICSRCGEEELRDPAAPLGHSYKETVTAPTCTEDGYTAHTCSRCGDSYTDSPTDALGHQPGKHTLENYAPPTPTTAGGYDIVV
jgi:formylmethanofuran dehydrogenase subunit E